MTPYLQALNRADITQLFPDCSATELALPDLTHVDWAVLDYFGWLHPSGHLGYVVVASEQGLQGMQLRRSLNHPLDRAPACALGVITFTAVVAPLCSAHR